jgi:DNA-directed RNA polymerase subunit RPC12/RpoP
VTFLSKLREAAFWEDAVCLHCGERVEDAEYEPGMACPECNSHDIARARATLEAVEQAMLDAAEDVG